MVYLMLVDLGYLDSCIVIAPLNIKLDTTALCNYDTQRLINQLLGNSEYKMQVEILKHPTPLECKKCGYSWTYRGKSPYFASCPYCRNSVNVKHAIRSESVLAGASTHPISIAKGAVDSNG